MNRGTYLSSSYLCATVVILICRKWDTHMFSGQWSMYSAGLLLEKIYYSSRLRFSVFWCKLLWALHSDCFYCTLISTLLFNLDIFSVGPFLNCYFFFYFFTLTVAQESKAKCILAFKTPAFIVPSVFNLKKGGGFIGLL